jgi:DNA-binding PadR family transcriptional regulator
VGRSDLWIKDEVVRAVQQRDRPRRWRKSSGGRTFVKITVQALAVLRNLVEHGESYGLQLSDMCGMNNTTVHGILHRLENHGLVRGRLESDVERAGRRSPRKYWMITDAGISTLNTEAGDGR